MDDTTDESEAVHTPTGDALLDDEQQYRCAESFLTQLFGERLASSGATLEREHLVWFVSELRRAHEASEQPGYDSKSPYLFDVLDDLAIRVFGSPGLKDGSSSQVRRPS